MVIESMREEVAKEIQEMLDLLDSFKESKGIVKIGDRDFRLTYNVYSQIHKDIEKRIDLLELIENQLKELQNI